MTGVLEKKGAWNLEIETDAAQNRQCEDTRGEGGHAAGEMHLQARGSQGLSVNTRSWQMKERILPWSDQRAWPCCHLIPYFQPLEL